MESRQSGSQRQRSASMFTNLQLVPTNIDPIQQQIDTFATSFPTYNFENNLSPSFIRPTQAYTQQATSQQQQQQQQQYIQQQFDIAKPYHQIKTPFPLELDKRFMTQDKLNSIGKRKAKEKTPSGSVRCFWALLSTRPSKVQDSFDTANLAFLHLDPALEESIGYSVESLIGTSVLDFIHPNEAMKIEFVILQYVQEKGNMGKMIRCTMKSVLSIGKYVHSTQRDRELDLSNFAQSIESDHQLTDIRLELIGDEMLLCFFHAVENPNDQRGNILGSNLCDISLHTFDDEHCQSLWHHILLKRFIEPLSSTTERHQSGFPIKIFQILTNNPLTNILFSWPPPRLFDCLAHQSSKSDTELYEDGSYFADIFARSTFETTNLEKEAESSFSSQFMTACMRKEFKEMTITTEGLLIEFEAMIIPRGEIKFAIFSILKAEKIDQIPKNEYRQQSIQPMEQRRQTFYSQSTFPIATIPSFQAIPAASNPFISQMPQMLYNLPAERMIGNTEFSEFGRRASADVHPITSHLHSPSVINNDNDNTTFYQSQPIRTRNEQSQISSTSSFPVRPPILESPLKKCLICGTSNTPEWRKGPDGLKSLCNACGLRFSRNASRAKKKEEKAKIAAEVAANGGIIPIHLQKKIQAEKERKKLASQKNPQQDQEQSRPQQQISDQMNIAEMSTFHNLSPKMEIQNQSSILTSSSDVNNSISPIGDLISGYNMNIDDEETDQFTSDLNYYQTSFSTSQQQQQQQQQQQ